MLCLYLIASVPAAQYIYKEKQLFTQKQYNLLTPDPHGEWTQVCCFVGLQSKQCTLTCISMYKSKWGSWVRQEIRVKTGGMKRGKEQNEKGTLEHLLYCWLGALFLFLPLWVVTDRVLTVLQMFLIFAMVKNLEDKRFLVGSQWPVSLVYIHYVSMPWWITGC